MKTVTIPSDTKPYFDCTINGRHYRYKAGATMSVPDEVAELIASIEAQKPKPRHYDPPAPELPIPAAGGSDNGKVPKANGSGYQLEDDSDKELPDATGKTGKFLKAGEKGPEWADPPSNAPFETTATVDGETYAFTLNKTAAELYAAVSSGKTVKITTTVGDVEIVSIYNVGAQFADDDYDFCIVSVAGTAYKSGHLSATDAVVLTPVAST